MAPYTFLDQHYLKFTRGKLSDFEGMMWYLQGFVFLGWCSFFTYALDVPLFSKRLLRAWPVRLRKPLQFPWCHRHCQIRIPWCNWGLTAPPLRVLQELDTAPLAIFHIPLIPPVCTSKVPFLSCSWCKRCPYYDCKIHESDYFQRWV